MVTALNYCFETIAFLYEFLYDIIQIVFLLHASSDLSILYSVFGFISHIIRFSRAYINIIFTS